MSLIASQDSFWASTLALALVAFGCAMLITLALLALLWPRLRRPDLSVRVRQFTSSLAPPTSRAIADEQLVTARSPEWADRLFGGRRWWSVFKEKVELARIERPPGEIVLTTAIVTLAAALILSLLTGAPALAIVILVLAPTIMLTIVNQRLARLRTQFGEQLPAHLQELASAMRAGHSFVGALRTIAESAAEPMRTELDRVLADEQLGVPLDAALQPMGERMVCDDVQQVALVAALHERTGGNMAAVLDQVAEGARERMELRRELRSLTAQGRLSRWVMTALPLVVLFFMSVINWSYVRPLFLTSAGVILLLFAMGMVMMGSLVMKAIVNVEA
jgi:tight adherence protein B